MAINIIDVDFTRWISRSMNGKGMGSVYMSTIGHDATQFGLLICNLFKKDAESSLVHTTNGKVWIKSGLEDQAAYDLWRMLKIFLGITKNATYATPPWAVKLFTPCILAAIQWLIEDEKEASPLIYQSLEKTLLERELYISGIISKLKTVPPNTKAIKLVGDKFGFSSTTMESLAEGIGMVGKLDFESNIKLINEKAESIEIQRAMLFGEYMALEAINNLMRD